MDCLEIDCAWCEIDVGVKLKAHRGMFGIKDNGEWIPVDYVVYLGEGVWDGVYQNGKRMHAETKTGYKPSKFTHCEHAILPIATGTVIEVRGGYMYLSTSMGNMRMWVQYMQYEGGSEWVRLLDVDESARI